MITPLVLAIAVLGPLPPEPARDAAADDLRERASFRRPVALAALGDARVAVANRRSGSVSVIDVPGARVVVETHIGGGRIADLAALDDGRLLACDETDHRLLLLERRDGRLSIADTLAVAPFPADVEVGEVDGRALISVASLWSRAVTLVGLAPAAEGRDAGSERDGKRLERLGVVELPFSPREQLLIGDRARLVVADSFAGGVALIDAATRRLLSTRQLPAHNIRGLALAASGDRVLVSHQILNPLAPTNFNDVHWGIVINNVLRWLSLETVLDPEGSLLRDSWFTLLGDTGNAAGDPGEVRIDVSGAVLVALAGVGEIAIVDGPASRARRIRVGRRPTAVLPWS